MLKNKVTVFVETSIKAKFDETVKYIESSSVIPYAMKEGLKKQILLSYRKDKKKGQYIKLDKKYARIFYAAYATVKGQPVNDYSFLYEYDNIKL